MPLQAPSLDTRTFEDILALARRRIPAYAPEWTDFNESDPGITLLELFAWLTELQLYELNRVPERSYVKFLQLLGMEVAPARPAVADLTFTPRPGGDVPAVPARTRVAAAPPGGGPPLIFETTEGLGLVRAPLADVQVFDGAAFSLVTLANDTPGTAFRPLGWVPQTGSALLLGFAPTQPPAREPIFPPQVVLRAWRPASAASGAAVQCGGPAAQPPAPPVRLAWEHRTAAGQWRRLDEHEDGTAAFTRDGYVRIEGPESVVATQEGDVEEPRFWLRCRLVEGAYPAGQEPELDALRPNTVPAENLTTERDEFLGRSDGHPGQERALKHVPVLAATLVVQIEASDEPAQEWTRVDDFLASSPDDLHYTLSAVTGRIAFGDGRRGRIPPAGVDIVAATYRHGGGAAGNVAAGMINAPQGGGAAQVVNERPAVGGRDEESVEDLKQHAPQVLRHRNRAVTAGDFAALAERAGGVERATAMALAHPDHRGIEVPGAITVAIMPNVGRTPRQPSADLVRHVCGFLDEHRLLTSEVYVKGPEYLRVTVQARVAALPYVAFDAVRLSVIEALNAFLSPVATVAGADGREWGRDLLPTSLYSAILDVEGVGSVRALGVLVDGRAHPTTEAIVLAPDGLVWGDPDHEIAVEPLEDR